jgi:hypothetical protein
MAANREVILMEPNLLPTTEGRKFRSEAEYRLWQTELAAEYRGTSRGKGLVSRIVNTVRGLAAQKDAPRGKAQRVHDRRPARQRS